MKRILGLVIALVGLVLAILAAPSIVESVNMIYGFVSGTLETEKDDWAFNLGMVAAQVFLTALLSTAAVFIFHLGVKLASRKRAVIQQSNEGADRKLDGDT